jgi:hypothetical protein
MLSPPKKIGGVYGFLDPRVLGPLGTSRSDRKSITF